MEACSLVILFTIYNPNSCPRLLKLVKNNKFIELIICGIVDQQT